MDKPTELEYLRELNKKYRHYLKRYFGFTLKDVGGYLGIREDRFSGIVAGRISLPEAAIPRLKEAFERFDIYAKTASFKESESDLTIRRLNEQIRAGKKNA